MRGILAIALVDHDKSPVFISHQCRRAYFFFLFVQRRKELMT